MVYDKTGTYDATFYFAGGLIALSGLLLIPIRCVEVRCVIVLRSRVGLIAVSGVFPIPVCCVEVRSFVVSKC